MHSLHAKVIDSHNYSIDWRGLLTIRNAIANGTKYRCTVEEKRNEGYGPKDSFVELLVLPKKPVLVITSLTTKTSYVVHTTDEPSKHFTVTARQAPMSPTTTTTPQLPGHTLKTEYFGPPSLLVHEQKKKADKVPILWPVKPGTNRISCPAFQQTLFLQSKYKYQYIVWYKCIAKCQSELHRVWQPIARMNKESNIHYENGTDAIYTLSTNGILEKRNVTVADNNTEYRCDVRTWDVVSDHIMLVYYEEKQVDGKWSAWGAWSPCTKTCGNGTSTRERVCNTPVPAHGGASCRGDTCEAQVCLVGHCSTPPTSIPTKSPPDNPDADSKSTGWKTRFIMVTLLLCFSVLANVVLAWQIHRYRKGQACRVIDGLEGADVALNGNGTKNGPTNQGKEYDSKETSDNDDLTSEDE